MNPTSESEYKRLKQLAPCPLSAPDTYQRWLQEAIKNASHMLLDHRLSDTLVMLLVDLRVQLQLDLAAYVPLNIGEGCGIHC